MRSQATSSSPVEATHRVASQLDGLIRRLVARSAPKFSSCTDNLHEHEANELILDHTVDGFRYLILRGAPCPSPESQPFALSPREKEIARMIAKGFANKTIAAVLEISCWTVGTHLRRMFAKLRVGTRAAMVARLAELQPHLGGSERPEHPVPAAPANGAHRPGEVPPHKPLPHPVGARRV